MCIRDSARPGQRAVRPDRRGAGRGALGRDEPPQRPVRPRAAGDVPRHAARPLGPGRARRRLLARCPPLRPGDGARGPRALGPPPAPRRRLGARAPPDRVLTVRLEELLLTRREETLAALLEFVGLGEDGAIRATFDSELTPENGHLGRWL